MRKKKYMIFVVAIVVVAMIVTIAANLIGGFGKTKNESIAKKVDKNNIIQKDSSNKNVKGTNGTKSTKNSVVLKNDASSSDKAKLVNDYLTKLVAESEDGRTEVSFKQNNKEVESAIIDKGLKSAGSNIKYSLRIQNGFLPMNRFVEVILDGDGSGHTVSVGNTKLKYSSDKKIFYGVVTMTDENKIKSSIKIK